jgi:hypothetical protein
MAPDLSMVFEGQRGKGTEAQSYKRVQVVKDSRVQVMGMRSLFRFDGLNKFGDHRIQGVRGFK